MTDSYKRLIVAYAIYLLIGACAYLIMVTTHAEQFAFPIVLIYILGYVAGRITKIIERT